ncbi:MAG: DUF1670 domain-containing protein [Bacillota bacterium]
MHSVQAKSVQGLLARESREGFGRSQLEAQVLAARSVQWLRALGASALPGQVQLSVPATPSRRYSRRYRRPCMVSAVDVGTDAEAWEAFGLAAMQRGRLVRWLHETYRQGGWASLAELAAWANLTPTALQARLAPLRREGIWLPHVGTKDPGAGGWMWEPYLVGRYLADGQAESLRRRWGIPLATWEATLRRFAATVKAMEAGHDMDTVAAWQGLSLQEVSQFGQLARRHRRRPRLGELLDAYGQTLPHEAAAGPAIEEELTRGYGFSPVAARLYRARLEGPAASFRRPPRDGELCMLAISADEGARARLEEARHVPVRLNWLTASDLALGPRSAHPTRVAELKFARLVRYATEARAQGALLSLPDLAVLMGIYVDAIRRQLQAHPEVVVPTRGRVKDIGRGVTHRTRIVELYLQMHTESEIVDRTGHSYESVEAYLKEFARVMMLADRGLSAVMIRRVTGRSMRLVEAYLELYRRYDQPAYLFRLAQLRQVFAREPVLRAKKGALPSRIGEGRR